MDHTIHVLIVDDSAVVRQTLSAVLDKDKQIVVVDTSSDPIFAETALQKFRVDVMILDLEMPRMNGLQFLKKLMAERPMPVIICSALTQTGAEQTMQCLSAGAVAVVPKPTSGLRQYLEDESDHLIQTVKAAARIRKEKLSAVRSAPVAVTPKFNTDVVLKKQEVSAKPRTGDGKLIVIGTSTGGTQALEYLFSRLPAHLPGIAIVQHMPAAFTKAFAERLNSSSSMVIKEAVAGETLRSGMAVVAPGGKHLIIRREPGQYRSDIIDGPPVNRHKPSVDVLFRSVSQFAGKHVLGIILTGMGDDGANGLLELRQAGARTLAQDEESCVVYGMPKEAVKRGGVEQSLSLDALIESMIAFA